MLDWVETIVAAAVVADVMGNMKKFLGKMKKDLEMGY